MTLPPSLPPTTIETLAAELAEARAERDSYKASNDAMRLALGAVTRDRDFYKTKYDALTEPKSVAVTIIPNPRSGELKEVAVTIIPNPRSEEVYESYNQRCMRVLARLNGVTIRSTR